MMYKIILFLIFFCPMPLLGQNYTSYFTGNANDTVCSSLGGVCLMGGASEDDNAMIWFLQRANGGDVLVLRSSGADGYNDYMYASLGVNVNSVETIVFNNASASYDTYLHQKIQKAEAIWFAGGDQWDYVSYWRNTPIDSLINKAIAQRNIVVGGTSAGMAILGQYYFSAQNGTVSSTTALNNPYNENVSIDSTKFIETPYLDRVITDTHYDNPDRKGRHTAFLARILTDYSIPAKGIACDEYTAICIDNNGMARVFGTFPDYDDNAYFIQTNCELNDIDPEICTSGTALTWNLGGKALKIYKIKGTPTGENTFDLNTWQTGVGGDWFTWAINNGIFSEQNANEINCTPLSIYPNEAKPSIALFPNPANDRVEITGMEHLSTKNDLENELWISDNKGHIVKKIKNISLNQTIVIEIEDLNKGIYYLQIKKPNGKNYTLELIKK